MGWALSPKPVASFLGAERKAGNMEQPAMELKKRVPAACVLSADLEAAPKGLPSVMAETGEAVREAREAHLALQQSLASCLASVFRGERMKCLSDVRESAPPARHEELAVLLAVRWVRNPHLGLARENGRWKVACELERAEPRLVLV